MDLGINGKIALVTASSEGLGLASATALAAEGATVCLASRSTDKLTKAQSKITSATANKNIHWFNVDMSDTDSIRSLCAKVKERVGSPDILVNNTGGPKAGSFFDLTLEDWEVAYRLLVASTVTLYRQLIPAMRENKWGRIVNITSTSSKQPIDGLLLSTAFRPGLLGLAKSVADDLGPENVLINSVMPGITMTARMTELAGAGNSLLDRLQKETVIGRAANTEELGSTVAFLCSEKASFITGSSIPVDGGAIRGY